MITERIREIVIAAAERQLVDPGYEFSEEEKIAISLLLAEQLEMQKLWLRNNQRKKLH